MENLNIRHDIINNLFYLPLQRGAAKLRYFKPDEVTMVLTETYVPEENRNRGVGSSLINHARDYASRMELKLLSECPFAEQVLH